MTEHDQSSTTVTLTRAALRESDAESRATPPLVRGNDLEATETDALEIPLPVADTHTPDQIQILHVDDNPDTLELAKQMLERENENFSIHTEANVVEGLNYLDNTAVDCIVSDYDMPRTDGLEFLAQVRGRYPDLPFILYTGKGSEEIASEAIAAGVTDYMQKQTGTDQYEVLSNRVRNAVDQYRTQEQFWNALSWYQHLVEQGVAGVFVVQEGTFTYVNDRFADIFGYRSEELCNQSFEVVVSESDAGAVLNQLRDGDSGEEGVQLSFVGQTQSGTTVPVDLTGGRTMHDGDPALTGIVQLDQH